MTKAFIAAALLCPLALLAAEIPKAPLELPPDERFKTGILLIVAHPDDETVVSGYLAKAIFDLHKRVSGSSARAAMAAATKPDSSRPIHSAPSAKSKPARPSRLSASCMFWILDGPDTPGQDVLRSLENEQNSC